MATISYGTRRARAGEVEHLGNISVDDIESITARELGTEMIQVLAGVRAREFWMQNSGEAVEWMGSYWRGRIGKFGALVVRVKP